MSILVRILWLLACAPLLLPPGVCVCHAGEPERGANSVTYSHPTPTPVRKAKRCCQWCPADTSASSAGPRTAPPTPHPAPVDDHHAPGCPATLTADRVQWVEPAQTVQFSSHFTEPASQLLAVARRVFAVIRFELKSASHPLYLSHCALVI